MRFKVLGPLQVTGSMVRSRSVGPSSGRCLRTSSSARTSWCPPSPSSTRCGASLPRPPGAPSTATSRTCARRSGRPDRGTSARLRAASSRRARRGRASTAPTRARFANGSPGRAGNLLREALALWTGPAFADLSFEPSLAAEIARLDELRLQALEERIAADLAEGRHGEVIGELESLTRELPLRERLWELLMLALYRARRPADALAAFERAREELARELGVDPRGPQEAARTDPPRRPRPGSEGEPLRGYRLLDQVGEGAFGVVYRAVQPQIGREVAIKAVHPELANHPDFVRRFEREAQIVARLEHPHVVPLYDYWREPDAAYLVMRFLRGGSVEGSWRPVRSNRHAPCRSWTRSRRRSRGASPGRGAPGREARQRPARRARQRLPHRLRRRARRRLTRAFDRDDDARHPAYLSPEQIRLDPASPRSDTYALGVMAFEMLTGTHPFPESSLTALLEHHANDVLPSVRTVRPELPAASTRRSRKRPPRTPATGSPTSGGSRPHCERRSQGSRRRRLTCPSARSATRTRASARSSRPTPRTSSARGGHAAAPPEPRRGRPGREVPRRRGPSGSGKSSVVRAGLVPALRRGAIPGSERWYVVEVVPGPRPFREIEDALLSIAVDPPLVDGGARARRARTARAVDRILPDRDAELLIVLDQFEEVFTLVEDDAGRARFWQACERRRSSSTAASASSRRSGRLLRRTALRRGVRRPARRPDRGDHADVPESSSGRSWPRPSRPVSSSSRGCSRR